MSKHNVVIEFVLNNIKKGKYKVGDKILTEKEFTKKFPISRITVHNALKDLAKVGIVKRIKGKGTFILSDDINDFIFEFNDGVTSKVQSTKDEHSLLSVNIIKPFEDICQKLEISANNRIYEAIRVMSKNGYTYGIDYSYICPEFIQLDLFKSEDFLINSFHTFLKQVTKIDFKKISIELEIHLSDNFESNLLNIPLNTPLVSWTTNIIDKNNKIIACTYSISKEKISLISFNL